MNQHPHEGRLTAVMQILGRRWLLIAVVMIAVMVITFLINFFLLERTYQAQVKIIYPLKRGAGFIKSNLGALDIPIRGFSTILDSEPTVYNHIAIINSRSVREIVVTKLNLVEHYGKKLKGKSDEEKFRGAVALLQKKISISDAVKGEVVVKVKDKDPKMAADISNAIIEATSEYLGKLYDETNGRMVDFLAKRLEGIQTQLSAAEDLIRQKKEETGILSLDSQSEQMIGSYAELEQMQVKAELEYRNSLGQISATENFQGQVEKYLKAVDAGQADLAAPYSDYLLKSGGGAVGEPQPNADAMEDLNIAFLRRQLSELELELATKRLAFTDEHPDVKVLVEQVADGRKALNTELLKYYDASLASLEIESIGYSAQVQVIDNVLGDYQKKMESYPTEEKQLLELEREKKVRESVLMVVEQEYEEAQIRLEKADMPFSILDEALPPRKPIGPRLIVNTTGSGALTAWLMLYLVFWHETRARRKDAAASSR